VLNRSYVGVGKLLTEHIQDFHNALLAKRVTEKHASTVATRVNKIVADCKFVGFGDVTSQSVNQFISDLLDKGYEEQTACFYVKAFNQFCRWMKAQRYIGEVPEIRSVKVPHKQQRAFEFDEFDRLLKAARNGPERFGMSGYQRYLVYMVAIETGLRRNELAAITRSSIDFKNNTIFVSGQHTKNSEDALQHISVQLAALLQDHTKDMMPNVKLFNLHDKAAKMIQADCRVAGIEVESNKGKLKFHSLRHTCGSFLTAKGVHPRVVQQIMRHKDINLTMSRYTHTLKGQVAAAVGRLPNFSANANAG
ncbi:MAG: tyrosine-type recombinase/integrase, partial [Planctomycetota bacterium]|jgi:integrase